MIGKIEQLRPPWRGAVPLTQPFGGNPTFYGRFSYGGVPLRGHNGIDVGLAVGTPLFAVDAGTVSGVGFEEGGFGHWLKIRHWWGQSVYGHLDGLEVAFGDGVHAGQYVARSGNSGGSTGPHLHFGLRVSPFERGDGWGGCMDPLPLLPEACVAMARGGLPSPSWMVQESEV